MVRIAQGIFAAFLLGSTLLGTAARADRPLLRPNSGSCGNYRGGLTLVAMASPDMGGIEPDVLVPVGTTVHLQGISEEIRLNGQCELISRTDVPFTWHVTERAQSGAETDKTGDLANANSLTPMFVAASPAIYFVSLSAGGQKSWVRIETVRRGHGWVSIGPSGRGGGDANASTGRVNDLAFDPNVPGRLYASTAWRGVFKSNDSGLSWIPMMDQKKMPHLGGGALAVTASGSVFAGLGDIHRTTKEGDPPDPQTFGDLWRSDDQGVTWYDTGGIRCASGGDEISTKVMRILIVDASRVLVATVDGVFRSTDGGTCWQRVPGLEHGMFTDISLGPNDDFLWVGLPGTRPNAGVAPVKSVWSPAPTVGNFYAPTDDAVSWVVLARAPSNPATVYFAITRVDSSEGEWTDVVKTITSPNGVTELAAKGTVNCINDCSGHSAIAVDPSDDQHVIYAEVTPHHSTNGGSDFDGLSDNQTAHDDFHALVYPPRDVSQIFAGTDGGVYRLGSGGTTLKSANNDWEPRTYDLTINQAQTLAQSPVTPGLVALGAWDNGSQQRASGRAWSVLRWGDGNWVAYDGSGDNNVYLNDNAWQGGKFLSWPSNDSVAEAAGFEVNPYNPGELWGQRVAGKPDTGAYFWGAGGDWRCGDPQPSAARFVNQVEFTPDGHYYVSAVDGSIWRFTLGGAQLVATCGSTTPLVDTKMIYRENPVAGGGIGISVDPFNPTGVYAATVKGPNKVVYVSLDAQGWTVQKLADHLPGVGLTGAVAADPKLKGVVYVGTRRGLWAGTPDGQGNYSWAIEADVPDTKVTMIMPERTPSGYTGVLRLSTYGAGIWERRLSTPCTPAVCIGSVRIVQPCVPCIGSHYVGQPPPAPAPESKRMEASTELIIAAPLSKRLHGGDYRARFVRVVPTFHGDPLPDYFLTRAAPLTKEANETGLFELAYVPPAGGADMVKSDGLLLQQADARGRPTGPIERVALKHVWRRPGVPFLRVESFAFGPLEAPVADQVVIMTKSGTRREKAARRTATTPIELPLRLGQVAQIRWGQSAAAKQRLCYLNGARIAAQAVMMVKLSQDAVLRCGTVANETEGGNRYLGREAPNGVQVRPPR
jgi:hypothetical protein